MHFLKRAASFLSNLGNSENSNIISTGVSFLKKIGFLKVGLFLLPVFVIFIGFAALVYSFNYKLNVFQLLDNNDSSDYDVVCDENAGFINYTENDFEECLSYTSSASIAGSYNEFVSHLSGTKFHDVNGFNNYIKQSVDTAGYGTPAGVVAAALALSCGYTKETGYKLFYQYPGMTERMDGIAPSIYMDCRAFVWWAWRNGGFYWANGDSVLNSWPFIDSVLPSYEKTDFNSIKPGDVVLNYSHVMLVVGKYNGGYYTAEESGYGSGLMLRKRTVENLKSNGYRIANMVDKYYKEPANKRNDRPSSSSSSSNSSCVNVKKSGKGTLTAEQRQKIVSFAISQVGVKYNYGSGGVCSGGSWNNDIPDKQLSCNGLTRWSYNAAGVSIPNGSIEQMSEAPTVTSTGKVSDMTAGDIICYDDVGRRSGIDYNKTSFRHVAIYIGNGELVEGTCPKAKRRAVKDNEYSYSVTW